MTQPTPCESVLAEQIGVFLSPTGWLKTFVVDAGSSEPGMGHWGAQLLCLDLYPIKIRTRGIITQE